MATVYLAIGTSKTGTSSLQNFFHRNGAALRAKGYCYPSLAMDVMPESYGKKNGHFLVYMAKDGFAEGAEKIIPAIARTGLEGDEKKKRNREIVAAVKNIGYENLSHYARKHENIILSEEMIWYRPRENKNFYKEVRKRMADIGCGLKVIVYLRRQDLLVQSLYNQAVKGVKNLSRTFKDAVEGDYWHYFPLDYARQLDWIADGVGKENLIVRVYERGQFEGGSLIHDFAKSIGLEIDGSFDFDMGNSTNLGLSGNFLEIKRILNGIPDYASTPGAFFVSPLMRANSIEIEGYEHSKTGFFSPEEQREYLNRYAEGNARVAREYLGREDGVLFYDPVEPLPQWKMDPEGMYRDIIIGMGEIFVQQQQRILELEKRVKELESANEGLGDKAKAAFGEGGMIRKGYRRLKRELLGR